MRVPIGSDIRSLVVVHSWVPGLLAIGAALLIAGGTVLRQREARATGGGITMLWCVGAAIALAGFALQAAALGLGSILLVQPLVVLAVLFALPLEAWADKRHPAPTEWAWGGVLVTCVVVFLLLARPESSMRRPEPVLLIGTLVGVIVGLIALVLIAERSTPHYKALCYGLTAGALFGVSALLIKALVYQVTHDPVGVFAKPTIYLFLVVVPAAIVAQQKSFCAGDLQTSFPAMTVAEPAVAMVLGVLLLGENLKVSVPTALFLGVVLALTMRSVVELAKLSAVRGRERDEAESLAADPPASAAEPISSPEQDRRAG